MDEVEDDDSDFQPLDEEMDEVEEDRDEEAAAERAARELYDPGSFCFSA